MSINFNDWLPTVPVIASMADADIIPVVTGGATKSVAASVLKTYVNLVSSVANSDGTLTISPTTGTVVASLALGHANTWTALQTFQAQTSGKAAVFKAAATTPGNIIECQNSAGTIIFIINPDGVVSFLGSTLVDSLNYKWLINVDGSVTTFVLGGSSQLTWSSNAAATQPTIDTGIVRSAASVVKPTDASSGSGWFQNTAGRAVLTSDVTNASDTLATTGLTVTIKAGRKYSFLAYLYVSTGAVLEGIKAALAGTATITNLLADMEIKSHAATPVFTMGRVTAFDSAIGQTVADVGNAQVEISGTIECNAAGTLRIDFAKNADTGALLTSVKRGSYFIVEDMP